MNQYQMHKTKNNNHITLCNNQCNKILFYSTFLTQLHNIDLFKGLYITLFWVRLNIY